MFQNLCKFGLFVGAGMIAGALVVLNASRGDNNFNARKACVGLLSQGMELKDKAMAAAETAKETLEDFSAEARHEIEARRATTLENEDVQKMEKKPTNKRTSKTA